MNAASKGHLPVVLYLLSKQSADPLLRNNWGETAYDIAAAVFEVWICEVRIDLGASEHQADGHLQILQKAEVERWDSGNSYGGLAVHTTVPLLLYENQRLDTRLKTLAINGGRPKFSASGLGKNGRRFPFELRLPVSSDNADKEVPAWRSDVQLPLRNSPWKLPQPSPDDRHALDGMERSHFWLSDWTLDVTHPSINAETGWQYAYQFGDPDEKWTAAEPPQLERLLTGNAATSFAGTSRRPSPASPHPPQTWVRRRRWVRVMRRRLDIPPLPFLQPDGRMYHADGEGHLVPYVDEGNNLGGEGQELAPMHSTFSASSQDYVGRARYLVGMPSRGDSDYSSLSAMDTRRAIAKLERATTELRSGILSMLSSDLTALRLTS